jgi:NADH:ubiquinone oxidoreductase subunit 6 (subunit J)
MLNVAFYGAIALTVASVLYLVFTKQLVRASFGLFAAFVGLAALYVFAGADVVAASQVVVYVGGVLVLLLFGVMLTQRSVPTALMQLPSAPRSSLRGGLLAAPIVIGVGAGLLLAYPRGVYGTTIDALPGPNGASLVQLGVLSLTDYLLAFELLSVVLLVALVGAASLSRNSANE